MKFIIKVDVLFLPYPRLSAKWYSIGVPWLIASCIQIVRDKSFKTQLILLIFWSYLQATPTSCMWLQFGACAGWGWHMNRAESASEQLRPFSQILPLPLPYIDRAYPPKIYHIHVWWILLVLKSRLSCGLHVVIKVLDGQQNNILSEQKQKKTRCR